MGYELPMVFNDIPSNQIKVTMVGGVGENRLNFRQDVLLVQSLLSRIPESEGGPSGGPAAGWLLETGYINDATITAIKNYQRSNNLFLEFGYVELYGVTIASLVKKLNSRNNLPQGLPNLEGIGPNARFRARQNVIFEFGFFIARLGRQRVAALCKGDIELPSDYHGVVYIPLDENGAWKIALAKEMKTAGLVFDTGNLI